MKIIRKIHEMQELSLQEKKKGKRIGLVPTMGFLHQGHLSLVDIARRHSDYLVMSIFVNPLQFGPSEDFDSYPRDFERDRKLAEECGIDCIFYPFTEDMYPSSPLTRVKVLQLDSHLCGRSRPGHFEGVTTIVTKLFNITMPDIAVFGLKDYQQFVIIKRMTEELHYPVQIIPGPTIREKDGLALSSRNKHLTPEERKAAPLLSLGLIKAKDLFQSGISDGNILLQAVRDSLGCSPLFKVDYIELADGEELSPRREARSGDVIAAAVFLGKTRLIDKIILG